jgi:hypothetical protein
VKFETLINMALLCVTGFMVFGFVAVVVYPFSPSSSVFLGAAIGAGVALAAACVFMFLARRRVAGITERKS